jgi:hypothetical protein
MIPSLTLVWLAVGVLQPALFPIIFLAPFNIDSVCYDSLNPIFQFTMRESCGPSLGGGTVGETRKFKRPRGTGAWRLNPSARFR